MEKTLVIIMGIQGSGKSTFFEKYLADSFCRINLDTLITRAREADLVNKCLSEGVSYAVDNTNPTRKDRERYIPAAKAHGYKVVGYFMESKLQECIKRNNLREGSAKIPAHAIAATSNKLEMPSFSEGFDELYFVKNDGINMTIDKWRQQP